MNGEFYIDGKKYISSKRAAKLTGYANDYIGQLARGGKLDSKMIGRAWFVDEESLLGYKRDVLDSIFVDESKKKSKRAKRVGKPSEQKSFTVSQASPAVPEFSESVLVAETSAPVAAPVEPATSFFSGIQIFTLDEAVKEIEGLVSFDEQFGAFAAHPELSAARETENAADLSLPETDSAHVESNEQEVSAASGFGIAIANTARGIGMLAIGAALAVFAIAIAPAAGTFYAGTQAGTVALGERVETAYESFESRIGMSPTYLNAGVAAVAESLGGNPGGTPSAAGAPNISSRRTLASTFESLRDRIAAGLRMTALAVYDGTNAAVSAFMPDVPNVKVHVAKLATNAASPEAPVPAGKSGEALPGAQNGMVVVPSTGDASKDQEIESYVKSSFSDDVEIVSQNDDGTGVLQPVFKDGKGGNYLYVIVPVSGGG